MPHCIVYAPFTICRNPLVAAFVQKLTVCVTCMLSCIVMRIMYVLVYVHIYMVTHIYVYTGVGLYGTIEIF